MAELIMHSKPNGRQVVKVDDEDLPLMQGRKWSVQRLGGNLYVTATLPRPKPGTKGSRLLFLHRHLSGLKPGDGLVVDHANHDTLDCRRCNMRVVTARQNSRNRLRRRSKKLSIYKGVYRVTGASTFFAVIGVWDDELKKTVNKYLGTFKEEVEAARAYDRAAILYHGEYAYLNFARSDYP